ncbi:MAG: B-box zinc finger protein [Anaerolineae bacterium]|nr:B-box zinc finger protein [Anaerolineae bacterium]
MGDETTNVDRTGELLYCTVHPGRQTALRCNKCNRPMCMECAVRTPVGYRCKECVYRQQNIFFNSANQDYGIAAATAFGISAVLGGGVLWVNVLLLTVFVSAPLGGLISEAVSRLTGRRRGRHTWWIVGLATALGALPVVVIRWLPILQEMTAAGMPAGEVLSYMGPDLLGIVLYMALAAGTAAVRFRYFRVR